MYKIVFHASGFEYDNSDDPKIAGFYVAVVICAIDESSAVNDAYQLLIASDKYVTLFPHDKHPKAMIEIDSVSLLDSEDMVQGNEISGFVFYPPDEHAAENSIVRH